MAYQGLKNNTPFAAELALLADEEGRDVLLVLAKATYTIIIESMTHGATVPMKEHAYLHLGKHQLPINPAGDYYGEPGKTSMKHAPEYNFAKLGTDIALIGHAHAPNGTPVTQLDVALMVGPVSKTVRVFGDRLWQCQRTTRYTPWRKTSWRMTPPQAFTSLPLIYERAFGGADTTPEHDQDKADEPRNPVGTGLIASHSHLTDVPLPNLEDPQQLIQRVEDRPTPAGFGFISPDWEPRRANAGTCDNAWQTTRMPLLPTDFDRRYLNAAHPDLQVKGYLRGDESVDIANASPQGRLAFSLPGCKPYITVAMANESPTVLESQLDSLIINTDDNTVQLLWCGRMDIDQRIYDLEKVQLMLSSVASHTARTAAHADRLKQHDQVFG